MRVCIHIFMHGHGCVTMRNVVLRVCACALARMRNRGNITNQKPWFVHKKPPGWRLQREANTTLCLHCLSLQWHVVSSNNSVAADAVRVPVTTQLLKLSVNVKHDGKY